MLLAVPPPTSAGSTRRLADRSRTTSFVRDNRVTAAPSCHANGRGARRSSLPQRARTPSCRCRQQPAHLDQGDPLFARGASSMRTSARREVRCRPSGSRIGYRNGAIPIKSMAETADSSNTTVLYDACRSGSSTPPATPSLVHSKRLGWGRGPSHTDSGSHRWLGSSPIVGFP